MNNRIVRLFFVCFYLMLSAVAHGQAELELFFEDRHCPVDTLFKARGVHWVIDSTAVNPDMIEAREFDHEGRLITWGLLSDTIQIHYYYSIHGDTLKRLMYHTINGVAADTTQEEQYVYNPKGRIVYFTTAGRNLFKPKDECAIEKFVYNSDGYLVGSESWVGKYPARFIPGTLPPKASFTLLQKVSCSANSNGQVTYCNAQSDNYLFSQKDSCFYDHTGRIERKVTSRKDKTYKGAKEFNRKYITTYTYNLGQWTQREIFYSDEDGSWKMKGEKIEETELNGKGLPVREYEIDNDGRQWKRTTIYKYYK